MEARGDFSVELTPQSDDEPPAGRLTMLKQYSGELQGTGSGQMISERNEGGESVYAAIERVEGELAGRKGGFTLFHTGSMSSEHQRLDIRIVEGSGSGDLEGIAGEMEILIDDLGHHYLLSFSFDGR